MTSKGKLSSKHKFEVELISTGKRKVTEKIDEFIKMTATEAVALLRSKEVSPLDLVDASIKRIEAIDEEVNALPIHCFDQARDQAKSFDIQRHADNPKSLCGQPIAVKDYNDLAGAVTTYGSPIFADNMALKSDATVRKLESNGAIAVAKSNVPEWAGGHTFNPVNGLTRNPWDMGKSAGGSSGGSAAALASGLVWLATGNDLGGSLRTPAAFNGVVGLRPSPGRVPRGTRLPSMDTLWVEGPMARNVKDLALMLDAGVGHQIDDPLSFDHSGSSFVDILEGTDISKRVAFSPDLSIVSMEKEIAEICGDATTVFTDIGAELTDEIPDFTGVLEAFQTLRAVLFATMMGPILKKHRDKIAPEIIDNIELGLKIKPSQIFEAERVRIEFFKKILLFFETHDFLICPAASIAPFPVDQRYVTQIDGQLCKTYIDWFSITFALTMTACPTISVPCGFTSEGLPVGIQIMGKPRGEGELLLVAKRFEQAIGISAQLPILPKKDH